MADVFWKGAVNGDLGNVNNYRTTAGGTGIPASLPTSSDVVKRATAVLTFPSSGTLNAPALFTGGFVINGGTWNYNIEADELTIFGGTFNGGILSSIGTISGSPVFNDSFSINSGTISGGTYNGMTNLSSVTVTGGTFTDVNAYSVTMLYGGTYNGNVSLVGGTTVWGGTYTGNVISYGDGFIGYDSGYTLNLLKFTGVYTYYNKDTYKADASHIRIGIANAGDLGTFVNYPAVNNPTTHRAIWVYSVDGTTVYAKALHNNESTIEQTPDETELDNRGGNWYAIELVAGWHYEIYNSSNKRQLSVSADLPRVHVLEL